MTIQKNDPYVILKNTGGGSNGLGIHYYGSSDKNNTFGIYDQTNKAHFLTIRQSDKLATFDGQVTATQFNGLLNGNASTATMAATLDVGTNMPATFHWGDGGSQPSWIWGGNDWPNMYVYHPSTFSVNYANTAGTANKIANSCMAWGQTVITTKQTSYTDVNGFWLNFSGIYPRVTLSVNSLIPEKVLVPLIDVSGNTFTLRMYNNTPQKHITVYWIAVKGDL